MIFPATARIAAALIYGTTTGLAVQFANPLGLGDFLAPGVGFAVAFFMVSSTKDLNARCTFRDSDPPLRY